MSPGDTSQGHQAGEATPQEVTAPAGTPSASDFGMHDTSWSPDQWRELLESLVTSGMASWKDVTALVLGHLNPSQVGTSLASSDGFKRKYGKGKTMRIVMEWVYQQTGRCADCGSRLELQADHIRGREQFEDPLDADFIENMTLRCRRCNVVRRPSHGFGGLTYLTAEAALMWILFVMRPRTFDDYARMCRLYGMTMSDIRMQEAWAMAHWLARSHPPAYGIEDDEANSYDLVLWPDGAITRVDRGYKLPAEAKRIYENVPGRNVLGFIAEAEGAKPKLHEYVVSSIPFSTYDLGARPVQSLAIRYSPPDRTTSTRSALAGLAPRGMKLYAHAIRKPSQKFQLISEQQLISSPTVLEEAPHYGRLLNISPANGPWRLRPIDV
jgi:hypothetical protein